MDYENLNKVTLYKTPLFSLVDTTVFESEEARDSYFDSMTDKLELDEFTDLYENREILIGRNYLDLKKYNTMKLYYNDGLGHTTTYYCNVDNYLYISTDTCKPIYRIDYWLTFSHLLYGKKLNIITDRRTVNEENVTKLMKPDEMIVPKVYYKPIFIGNGKEHNYVIFLNSNNGVTTAKKGINAKMETRLGIKMDNTTYYQELYNYTTGCFVVICKEANFSSVISSIPMEYIEKVLETELVPTYYLGNNDRMNYDMNGFAYLTEDVTIRPSRIINVEQNGDTKKIIQSLPYSGYVCNGFEYNSFDFDKEYLPTFEDMNPNLARVEPSLHIFVFLGETFLFPIAYKGQGINYDYMQTWTNGRTFNYLSDYVNSLAYKQTVELNAVAVKFANDTAGLTSYYAKKIADTQNQLLDTSKLQSTLSYQASINSLNTQKSQLQYESEIASNPWASGFASSNNVFGQLTAGLSNFITGNVTNDKTIFNNSTNISLFNKSIKNLYAQNENANSSFDLQKQANNITAQFQSDTAGLSRDNAIANITIANKYNNSKPNAYSQSQIDRYDNFVYKIMIDNRNGTDYTQYENIVNYYNINGIKVGFTEEFDLSNLEGHFYHYVKGSIIEMTDLLENVSIDIIIMLLYRIESGIRIWHNLQWFGNLTTDNTFNGDTPPLNTFSILEKRKLENKVLEYVWDNSKEEVTTIIAGLTGYTTLERNYLNWYNENLYWVNPDSNNFRMMYLRRDADDLKSILGVEDTVKILKTDDNTSIYEAQNIIEYVRTGVVPS